MQVDSVKGPPVVSQQQVQQCHTLATARRAYEGKAQGQIREIFDAGVSILEGGVWVPMCLYTRVEGRLFRHGTRQARVFPRTIDCSSPAA